MEKKWEEMSAKEKRAARIQQWLSTEGIHFQSKEAETAYKAAMIRFKNVALMEKIPDRVPVMANGTFMQTYMYGVTPYEAMYDYDKLISVHRKYLQDFRPDYSGGAYIGSGKILDILDYKLYKWPGHGLAKNSGYQAVEREYMLAEEYQAFINDPSDFWLRTYLPRVFGALEPLKQIPPFTNIWEIVNIFGGMVPFGIPPVQNALKALIEAGNEAMAWIQKMGAFDMETKAMGFPSVIGGIVKAPFDVLGDTLRGSRGIMVDIYRQPDMVLKAIEVIIPMMIKQGMTMVNMTKVPFVLFVLHKGADGFMSDEQFKKFYWPSLKEVMLAFENEGCISVLFCEGGYNSRLQYLKELSKGSTVLLFDRTDMAKAKKVIGNKLCIGGNVPAGMLLTGTPEEVKEYCKNLIDVVGKGGGYIMSFGTAMDEGKPETVHAMIDFTKEYGRYK
jgi:hypothetical protein